jgi:hypothetical protein
MTKTEKTVQKAIPTKSLLDTAQGAIKEQIAYNLAQVVDNICDLNTDSKKARRMQITLDFTPSGNRAAVETKTLITLKLQPTDPIISNFVIVDNKGKNEMVEYNPHQTAGQLDLDGNEIPQEAVIEQIR